MSNTFSFDSMRTHLEGISANAPSSVVDLYAPFGGSDHRFSSIDPGDIMSKLHKAQDTSRNYNFYELFHDLLDCDIPIVEPDSITEDQIEYLGGGATMNVYEGVWQGRSVALKRFSLIPRQDQQTSDRRYDSSFRDRVRSACREIRLMSHANLQGHRNIVQLLAATWTEKGDSWDNELNPTLIVELADKGSETLEDLFSKELISLTDTGFKAFLLSDIIQGLHAIHKHGIVHGDLKPQNVLLFSDNYDRITAKISDFGFSQELASGPRAAGGTEYWNAPECFPDCPPEWLEYSRKPSRDVYSFGLLAIYILTGKLPYQGRRPLDDEFTARMKQKLDMWYVLVETEKAKSLGLPCLEVLDQCTEYADYILQGDKFQETGNLAWAVLDSEKETRDFGQGFLSVGIIKLSNALLRDPRERFKTRTLVGLLAVDEQGRRKELDLSPKKHVVLSSNSTMTRKSVGEAFMRVPPSMRSALLSRLEAEARGANGSILAQFFLAWTKLDGIGVPKEMNATELFRKMMSEWDPKLVRYVKQYVLEASILGKFGSSSIFDVQSEIEALERELEILTIDAEGTEVLTPMSVTRTSIQAACRGGSSLEDHRELLRDLFRRYCGEGVKAWIPLRFRPPQFPEASLEAELISLILQKGSSALETLDNISTRRQSELSKISSEAAKAIFFFAAEEGNFNVLQKLSHADLLRKFNSIEAIALATESPCVLYHHQPFQALLNSGGLGLEWVTINVVRTAAIVSRDSSILDSIAGIFEQLEEWQIIPQNTLSRLADDNTETSRSVMPGVQYSKKQVWSFSALHSAVLADNLTAFRFFLDHGCNINVRALSDRYHLLHTAAGLHQVIFVGILLGLGVDPNVRTMGLNSGFTPLHILCCNDLVNGFRESRDSSSTTLCKVVHFAEESYQARMEWRDQRFRLAVMELLLRSAADANAQDWDGATPLLHCLQSGEVDLAETLVEFPGTDVGICDFRGESVIHAAVRTTVGYIVEWILSVRQTASLLEVKTVLGATPLWTAARLGLTAIVRLLLDAGARSDSKDVFGITVMQAAILNGHLEVATLILEKLMACEDSSSITNAICERDVMGRSTVHYLADFPVPSNPSISEQHSSLLDFIFGCIEDVGNFINTQDCMGCTPLQLAMTHGNHNIIAKLIDYGADESILSKFGKLDSGMDLIEQISDNNPGVEFWTSLTKNMEMHFSVETVFSFSQEPLDQSLWCEESTTAIVLRALCRREVDYWSKGYAIGMEIQERRLRIFTMENASKLYGPDWRAGEHSHLR